MDMDKLRATSDIVAVIGSRVPLTRRGREFVAPCPFHDDATPSFYVIPDRQFFHCFGCSASGDIVDFVQRFDGIDFKEAVEVIQKLPPMPLPMLAGMKASTREQDWVTEMPPATEPQPATFATKHHGEPVAVWCYKTLNGSVWGYAARYSVERDGVAKKAILQWTFGKSFGETQGRWACKHFSRPRPLYGLEHLYQKDRPVMIVEGEKTVEAARTLFPQHLVLSWAGGVAAVKYADWTPLAGRECVIVPDADAVGKEAAFWIQARLVSLGCRVEVVTPEASRPSGWDLADAVADEWLPEEAAQWLQANRLAVPMPEPNNDLDDEGEPLTPPPSAFSEDALAQRFVTEHGQDLRFVKAWGVWMLWQGHQWVRDEQDVVKKQSQVFLRGVVNWDTGRVLPETMRRKINALRTAEAVVGCASFSPTISTAMAQWDRDPLILSTPGGTVDLRTGLMRPARREDLLIQSTSVTPSDGTCPIWMRFLDTVMDHDQALVSYLQRLVGYALTGVTVEQQLAFFYGTGGNGKSVFLSAIRAILGSYATISAMTTFTESKMEKHPADIADLKDARLVISQETEEGRKWAESLIKSLTGGDPIKARYMRQNFFEFTPKFKLIFAGNHKPALRTVDEAMRRRMHIVPWTVTIPKAQRDPLLGEKLAVEYPAILRWMIDGCLLWQQQGLAPPDAVLHATDEYLIEEDVLRGWLDDNCVIGADQSVLSKDLRHNYVAWCEENKEFAMGPRRLSSNLISRGMKSEKIGGAQFMVGISLKSVEVVPTW